MLDHTSYEDFIISRRGWFFGALAATYLIDSVEPLIKDRAHFQHFGSEYLIRTPVLVALCVAAALTIRRSLHAAFVAGTLGLTDILDTAPVRHDRLKPRDCNAPEWN